MGCVGERFDLVRCNDFGNRCCSGGNRRIRGHWLELGEMQRGDTRLQSISSTYHVSTYVISLHTLLYAVNDY